MTNKRKSMNTGDDVHAISARYTQYIEGAAAIAKQCSKGFRDVSLTSLGPHGHCLQK